MDPDRDTMRPEYDFAQAVRGATAARYAEGANLVQIDRGGGSHGMHPERWACTGAASVPSIVDMGSAASCPSSGAQSRGKDRNRT